MITNNFIAISSESAGELVGLGPLGMEGESNPLTVIANVVTSVIGIMTVIAAIYFVIMVISGAITMISSAGDKGAAEDARRKITNGIIGIVIAIGAVFILSLVSTILDLGNLLDLSTAIQSP